MATNPDKSSDKSPRRRGRPSKADELQKMLAALAIDPRTVDPLAVLAGIMMDATQPAAARVQAARLLIAARDQAAVPKRRANGKAEPKRVIAQRAAANAGGEGSEWGSDLWPDGRRPQ